MIKESSPSEKISEAVVLTLTTISGKETTELGLNGVYLALQPHLSYIITKGSPDSKTDLTKAFQAIVKDMTSTKSTTKITSADLIGEIVWNSGPAGSNNWSKQGEQFGAIIIPALASYLKGASATTVTTGVTSILEGYVAVALGLGRLSSSSEAVSSGFATSDPILSTVGVVAPKTSFLFLERLQKKVIAENDDTLATKRRRVSPYVR